MKNRILNNNIKVLIEGKNINNYIKRLIKQNIYILDLKYISYNKAEIILNYNDYLRLKDTRSIYKLKVIEKYGKLKIKDIIKKNIILLLTLILGLIIIIISSNFIFSIEIIHTNKEIVKLINNELSNYEIEKYKFKKSYEEIEIIEDKILDNNKDKLEWIEIEVIGTKYIVRIEERKIKEKDDSNIISNIIMAKSGVLKKVLAISGEKIKNLNTFVSKGDTVISGIITKPNGETVLKSAKGLIYAEVWYEIEVEYPYNYKEEILTGNSKNVYYLNFFNKKISIFGYKKFNSFKANPKIIMYGNIVPISFVKEKQYEVNIIDEIYTEEQVIDKAIILAEEKLVNSNNKIESIDKVSIIKKEDLGSKIKLNLFISVIEEVGEIQEINVEDYNNDTEVTE